jgi:hypothetical protein
MGRRQMGSLTGGRGSLVDTAHPLLFKRGLRNHVGMLTHAAGETGVVMGGGCGVHRYVHIHSGEVRDGLLQPSTTRCSGGVSFFDRGWAAQQSCRYPVHAFLELSPWVCETGGCVELWEWALGSRRWWAVAIVSEWTVPLGI